MVAQLFYTNIYFILLSRLHVITRLKSILCQEKENASAYPS